jgi:hypothetical protein
MKASSDCDVPDSHAGADDSKSLPHPAKPEAPLDLAGDYRLGQTDDRLATEAVAFRRTPGQADFAEDPVGLAWPRLRRPTANTVH